MLKHAIAITGGIACGKSSVSNLLKKAGFVIICADEIAHNVLESSAQEIIDAFGERVRNVDSRLDSGAESDFATNSAPESAIESASKAPQINRKALGEIVFADSQKRALLESITHPKIHAEIMRQARIQEGFGKWYFLDIPLFFESGGKARYPAFGVLCVASSEALQIQRLKQRNGFDTAQAKARIAAQISLDEKIKSSDWVIENNSTQQNLEQKVASFISTIKPNNWDTGL
ncbi:hypothetical protein BKN38_00890 [Helicobacter sp. CLO-3]|uniref:dephospho-CoA kinase n=1 Tax=unclassified Helicobacter TaxID=2593540 RepID=UPI0008056EF6|nr:MULTISPECIES: dephospho-CoA kinase [unclassified Helicobacter]OBV29639.1 hypothetical protein BA723_04725 [Helicobacter sp. CLO-3]OHU85609.1 hypothetical protein BKN38_00890 [Helicobacter sp. CLO-3]